MDFGQSQSGLSGANGSRPLPPVYAARKTLHALAGLGAILLRWYPPWVACVLLAGGVVLSMAVGRRARAGRLLRPGEGAVSGAVTYAIGVALAILLLPSEAAFAGWLVLAGGDCFSAIAGTRMPLVRWHGGRRSLGGALGFVAGAAVLVFPGVAWWHGGWGAAPFPPAAASVLAGALAESLLSRWDDNLFIPLVAGGAYSIVVAAVGS